MYYSYVHSLTLIMQESAIQAALTLRHSKLVWRRGETFDERWYLEPIRPARPAISTFTVSGGQKVRRRCNLGY